MTDPWRETLPFNALRAGGERRFVADPGARERVAGALDLEGLDRLEASLDFGPWLDGAVVNGTLQATAIRRCGVSLDLFPETIDEPIRITFVPVGSPHAPEPSLEVEIDPEAEDPPEVVTGNSVDLGAYLVEALSLALDPFPRKPGAVFEPLPVEEPELPFAALRALRTPKGPS